MSRRLVLAQYRKLLQTTLLGAVKATGFTAIAVENGEAKLDVVVSRSDALGESAEWKPVSTNILPVPAPGEQGFFIVVPAAPSDSEPHVPAPHLGP